MTNSTDIAPTKTHRGENFPVASLLIAPRHRATILAFYRFARAADDIADHPTLAAHDKLARLDLLEHALLGKTDAAVDALPLRQALGEAVEQLELAGGLDEALVLVLAVKLDEEIPQALQQSHRGRGVVDEDAVPARPRQVVLQGGQLRPPDLQQRLTQRAEQIDPWLHPAPP